MKKQALFAVCLTAASAAIFTGCATKQDTMNQQAQMEATEITATETQAVEAEICAEPTPEVTPAPEAAPTPAPAPAPAAEPIKTVHPQPVTYIVTSGDSVSAIAVRFNVRRPDILALNPTLAKNPNGLRVGQKVLLPAGTDLSKKAVRRPTSATPANAKRPAGTTTYVVKSGDVLGGIAIKHGVTVAAIKSANNLQNDSIWVGQKLTIPGATKKPAPAKKAAKPAEKKAAAPAKKAEEKAEVPAPVVEAPVAPVVEELALPEQAGEDSLLPPEPIAPAADAAPAVVESERVHVVKEGEDLLSIAMRWSVSPAELRALNGIDDSADPKLAPGTTLRVPMPVNLQ
jgi:LysM repeat protein